MFTTKTLLPCVALVSSAAVSSVAIAQTVAVNLGDDLAGGNQNSNLDDGAQLQVEVVDIDGDTVNDARTFIPIDHTGSFIGAGQVPLADPGTTTTNWRAGMQIVNYGTNVPSDVNLFRLAGNSATNDSLQMTSTAQAAGATSQGAAFLPHVVKDDFLGGLSAATELSFTDVAGGFTLSYGNQNTPDANGIRRARLLAQDGSQWYISDALGGGSSASITINPFSETWYPIDLTNNFFYDEVGGGDLTPTGSTIGAPVLGSTFTDIQALGAHLMKTSYDGSGANEFNVNVNDFVVSLDAVFPPPPEPVVGLAVVDWDMDTITPGVSTTEIFGNTFTGDAVIDGSGTPNPGLVSGETNDPLFLGDITPGGALGPIPPATMPTQTVGNGGAGGVGEALSFDGVDDEAYGVIAWLADSTEATFIDELDGVYVNLDFNEVDKDAAGLQTILSARNTFELRINDGDLEWVTWLEAGGTDTIAFELDASGGWHNVEAFLRPDGVSALYVDGVLAGQSAPGLLKIDRRSIVLGNTESEARFFEGLIDNVFVGGGILDALLEGDANGDGNVDLLDFDILASNFGAGPGFGGGIAGGDFNEDGNVDLLDFDILAGNFGASSPGAVPEPASLGLLALGGAALLRGRRRRA
ncbi:MAG: LamG-like jellyroll fold domain-containing protein [Planctomycetota bacterium]